MTPEDESKPYHHGDLREALLEASLALIAEGGVQALSLRAAARRAGVSPGAPYHHFSSRAALLASIGAAGFNRLHDRMSEARGAAETSAERLSACGRAYVQFALEEPAYFRVMFRPELADREVFPELSAAGRPVFETLVGAVLKGQEAGTVPGPDPQPFILLCWACVHGLSSLLLDGPLSGEFEGVSVPHEEIVDVVTQTLERVLRGAAAAER